MTTHEDSTLRHLALLDRTRPASTTITRHPRHISLLYTYRTFNQEKQQKYLTGVRVGSLPLLPTLSDLQWSIYFAEYPFKFSLVYIAVYFGFPAVAFILNLIDPLPPTMRGLKARLLRSPAHFPVKPTRDGAKCHSGERVRNTRYSGNPWYNNTRSRG